MARVFLQVPQWYSDITHLKQLAESGEQKTYESILRLLPRILETNIERVYVQGGMLLHIRKEGGALPPKPPKGEALLLINPKTEATELWEANYCGE